jgi:hypothetical protein
MKTTPFRTALLLLPFSIVAAHSAPIQNLTFTEVIKDVFVIDPATKAETPAKTGDKLVPPNVLKTGADSRAELIAEDKTVTRVGSNTIFSVEANSRDVNLAQGSVLFHSPAGRGGGRIKSAGATASVLGTTLAVSANSDGGFKTSLLEGKGEVKDPKGGKVGLVAGQVTFAKPGGGLSPALNFDLKAQIANSKLVGGFAAPLASIAKIEAAVAVQQAKIAGGGLVSTGMLIGDRPDTAFKVDAAIVDGQIRQAQTRREEQIKAEKETQTFYEVDPRYLTKVLSNLSLPRELTGGGIDQTAPDSNVFIIDRTGRALLDDPNYPLGAIGGVPSNLPGNRQDSTVTYHALIANEISLTLTPKESAEPTQFFLPIPLIDKVGAAMVARENLNFSGAIDFVGVDNIQTTPDGYETGQTLLLSAGKTINIAQGSTLLANTSLFEIYAGGSSFSGDLSLELAPLGANETPVPLTLDGVALINKFPLDPTSNSNGIIRITAPEIDLNDTLILAASDSSEIALESKGAISIKTSSGTPTAVSTNKNNLLVSLGFEGVKDLCLKAFKVGIRSESKTVSLNGISLYANEITLRGGDKLELTSVLIDPFDFQRELSLTASALNTVTIDSALTLGENQTGIIVPATVSTTIYSDNADVIIKNTEFGFASSPNGDTEPKTAFTANALNGNILLTASAINADTVLFNGKTVTFEGVNIAPTDSGKGTIQINSASDLSVTKGKTTLANSFKAYRIILDSKNNMKLEDLAVHHVTESHANEFKATAANDLTMKSVSLQYAQNVALEASTVVLEDVSFKAGSFVSLKSTAGVLSTPENSAGITKGWVNVLPRVMYGAYDLNKLSEHMGTFGTQQGSAGTKGIPASSFPAVVNAVQAATANTPNPVDLSRITIAAKPTP